MNLKILEEQIEKKFVSSDLPKFLLNSYRHHFPRNFVPNGISISSSVGSRYDQTPYFQAQPAKNVSLSSSLNPSGSAYPDNEVGPDTGYMEDNENDGTEEDETCLHVESKYLDSATYGLVFSEKAANHLKETEPIDGDDVSHIPTPQKN